MKKDKCPYDCPVCALELTRVVEKWEVKNKGEKKFTAYKCGNCYNFYTKKELEEYEE